MGEKDMGGWTAIQFTGEQQAMYGVNADGEVVNQEVHDAALKKPPAPAPEPVMGGGMICGGFGGDEEATSDIQAMCDALMEDICKGAQATGWSGDVTSIKAVTYKS